MGRASMASSEEDLRAVAVAEEQAGKEGHPGNEKLAQKLLKPRRRAQIEVWLGEIATRWETQRCAAGRSFGHHSDQPTPPATGQPGEGPRSTAVDGDDRICPVCGRPFEDGNPVAAQPERTDQQSGSGKPGKGKHMFRGIRTAMGQFKARDGGRGGKKDGEERWDRAMSTQMFLAEGSEVGSSIGSSRGPFDGGQNKELEERMARLMRAQKLLERSQASPGG